MDTTEKLAHIGLCAGYGGIELGLKRVLPALRTVALCEIEAFAVANLVAKMEAGLMDAAPIWTDLKTFPWAEFRDRVDILTGGYPCQPFSSAGKRAGADDPRHLWPFISSGIQILRPRLCFFENVEGHISLGLREVIADLESLGYETAWGIFSAAECGAPHQRRRVFIMAHRIDQGSQGWLRGWQDSGREGQHGHTGCGSTGVLARWPSRPGQPQHAWEPSRVVENSIGTDNRCQTRRDQTEEQEAGRSTGWTCGSSEGLGHSGSQRCQQDAALRGQQQTSGACEISGQRGDSEWDNGQTEPTLGGDTDGPASGLDYAKLSVSCDNRADELRLLGNGVVPATAAIAFRTLLKELTK